MLRGFTFLQFALMGLLRETGRHLAGKGRISDKNVDKVNFWPHWQRFLQLNINYFFFLFPVTLIVRWCLLFFFSTVSQVHIEILPCVKVEKMYSTMMCLYSILNTKDTRNLTFSFMKLHHKTYPEFERLPSVVSPESKLENVMSLSKTCWWVQSCWVQCHKN